ncbi:hypothetical protein HYDPIDRAFT_107020 [Hydnomerulius pinastri MD-312]|nr:hypothetical protein HYDPIDRAFT_107020 [Hydnomerulius pinastri MD-312]
MPRSLRRVLTPPQEYAESPSRPRSVLFESALPQSPTSVSAPSSPYSKPRYSPSSDHSPTGGVPRARQSVSSIGSCSTIQTRTVPVKSILTRHDSGISMATTTNAKTTSRGGRKKKRSPPSVKFVEAPTVHYDHGVYINTPPCSPPATLGVSGRRKRVKPSRWFTRWWKRSPSPPPRPVISGPYHLSYTASLVDVYASRSEKAGGGRLKRLWVRITSAIS